ncbi:hypothetical protein [Polaromonas sp. CG9_12]|nr:hypothetical protein [Polaromonas sp. CG9_12]
MSSPRDQIEQDNADFDAAYADDLPPEPAAQSEDEAFGLLPEGEGEGEETAEGEDALPNSPDEAEEVAEGEPPTDAPAAAAEPALSAADLAREIQRLKSWEGRLKVRESGAKADPLGDGLETEFDDGELESPAEEAGEDAAAKLKGMDPDEALRTLANDFGDDFAAMLNAVIEAKVAQSSARVSQSVDEIINDIVDTREKQHFEAIADAHPDFMDVANSDGFKAFTAGNPAAAKVVQTGTAREICKMLAGYKASAAKPARDQASDDDMDAAEGVRSTGLRLPTAPGSSKDYAGAWDEFDV